MTAPSSKRLPAAAGRFRYPSDTPRRRDYLIAVGCSLLLHSSLFLGDILFPGQAPVRTRVKEEAVIQMVMPDIEPEKLDEVHELSDESAANIEAPPMLADLPHVVPINAFVQPLQPPLPPGVQVGKGVVTIPVGPPGKGFGQGMKDLFDINNLDQRPALKAAIPPDYPYQLRQQNLTGRVTVEFIIDTSGNVVAVQVLDSSNEGFELAAVRAVQKWKFRPGRKAGRVVNSRVQQIITFNLEKD